ncbi:hypothetical protein BV22DRAFT_1051980 [Leucogyrophana mollusca]|uniref:Uncharacterized protein n=1 Tax=Leucogyrophana mollusca TaxID=85980 RepID=A0ACB8AXU4_9AGAM|nr:hypothetical protein BV22DRAFT_1051980 [Leucogyrophana mollusca]
MSHNRDSEDDEIDTNHSATHKRRITALEEENAQLQGKTGQEPRVLGFSQPIRCISDFIHSENPRRRLGRTIRRLVSLVDRVHEMLEGGADGSRGDDTRQLKGAVALWLNEEARSRIKTTTKGGRGFYNNTTGALLYPVDYDWSDPA